MYLVTSEEGQSWVAKVAAAPYPGHLHKELSYLGLAPQLVGHVEDCLGGAQVIKMQHLDAADGWVLLCYRKAEWDTLYEVALEALKALQSCLDDAAVHGDLNYTNILVRYAMHMGSSLVLQWRLHCPRFVCTCNAQAQP